MNLETSTLNFCTHFNVAKDVPSKAWTGYPADTFLYITPLAIHSTARTKLCAKKWGLLLNTLHRRGCSLQTVPATVINYNKLWVNSLTHKLHIICIPGISSSSSAGPAGTDLLASSSLDLDKVEASHFRLSRLSGPSWLRMFGSISDTATTLVKCSV